MKHLANIFLSRSTSSLYVGCQFLLLYGVLPPQTSAHFIFALMCVGFIPLADLTLSVNSAAFRQHAGTDSSFVTGLVLCLCGLTALSATVVLGVTSIAMQSDPHTVSSTAFFYMTSMVVTINMAIPMFHDCRPSYVRVMKLVALSDLIALGIGVLVALKHPEQALVLAVFIRLLLSLLFLLWVGGRAALTNLAKAARWWVDQVQGRPRFIGIQVISVAAGAALFSFPSLFLLSSGGKDYFVQYALAMALTNIIVSLLSSFFSARTDVLLQAASGMHMRDRLVQAKSTLKKVIVLYAPISIVALISLLFLNKWLAEHLNIVVFAAFSPIVSAIVLCAGYFNLCSQVVAMGQRIRGFDRFALPAFIFGIVNILAIYQLGTSPFSVAVISVCFAMAGFTFGAIFNGRFH
jgi:hypothetical protein